MRKPLLETLFMSEKRKRTLLLLREGPTEAEILLKQLDTSRQALLTQIKILQDDNLIMKNDDVYELTTIGHMIVDRMASLLGTIDTLDVNIDFWGNHNMDFLPPYLMKRIRELRNCTVVEPSMADIFELNKRYMDQTYESGSLCTVTTFLHPHFMDTYSLLADNGVDTSVIASKELFQKIKKERYDDLKYLLDERKIRAFVYSKPMES